jgi:hypothetical protein
VPRLGGELAVIAFDDLAIGPAALAAAEMVRRRLLRADAYFNREPYVSTTLRAAHRRLVLPQRASATHVVDGRLSPDALAQKVSEILQRVTP